MFEFTGGPSNEGPKRFSILNLDFKIKWSVFFNTLNGQMINFLLSVINEKKFLYMFYNLKRSSVKSLNFYSGRKKFLDESVYLA